MYQLACKISPDENQIVTNEWTITVNWIDLTSFQEISGNGERCKSVKHADAEPRDAAGDLVDRRGFAGKREKGCQVSYKKKRTPFCYKIKYKLRVMVAWRVDHHYYYSSYYLYIFVGKILDAKDIKSMEPILVHCKPFKSIFVRNEEACSCNSSRQYNSERNR